MVKYLVKGLKDEPDGKPRCFWHNGQEDYIDYHDIEWGRPVYDDYLLFEKICLEGFQSGLSWLTILRKRENFRSVFKNFDFRKVSRFNQVDVERLLLDKGIIRHRGKILATINNAQRAIEMEKEFGSLASYFWAYQPSDESRPKKINYDALMEMSLTEVSMKLSKDLKMRGWRFVGPTTCYSFMQAMGIVNDHIEGCYVREEVETQRQQFIKSL